MTSIRTVMDEKKSADRRSFDMALTLAAASGDRCSQRKLVHRVLPRVQKTVYFLAGARPDTEDLSQMALMQIVRSAGSFRGECLLDYWTDRVVLQTLAKQFEKRTRRERIRERFWFDPPTVVAVDDQAALLEVRARFRVLFGKLKERHRVPVVLHYVHGYEIEEIATLTDTKVNTVRGRLRVGIGKLRKQVLSDPAFREWIDKGMK